MADKLTIQIEFLEKGIAEMLAKLKSVSAQLHTMETASAAGGNASAAASKKATAGILAQAAAQKKANDEALKGTKITGAKEMRSYRAQQATLTRAITPPRPGETTFRGFIRGYSDLNKALAQTTKIGRTTGETLKDMNRGAKPNLIPFTGMERARIRTQYLGTALRNASLHLRDMGKNAQWTGRQMIVGLSLPLFTFGLKAIQTFTRLNEEFTRTQKVLGTDVWRANSDEIKANTQAISERYGVSQALAAGVTADLAAMGYEVQNLGEVANNIFRTEILGDVDTSQASTFFRSLQKIFVEGSAGVNTFHDAMLGTNDLLNKFNAIENRTSINVRDLATALPLVAVNAKLFGLTGEETASVLAAMYDKGIDATEAANALKFSFIRIVNPTKKASELFKSFGVDLSNLGKDGLTKIETLSDGIAKLDHESQLKATSELVGARQSGRFLTLLISMQQAKAQIKAVRDYANANNQIVTTKNMDAIAKKAGTDLPNAFARAMFASGAFYKDNKEASKEISNLLTKMSAQEIRIKLASPENQLKVFKEKFQNVMAKIGGALLPYVLKVAGYAEQLVNWFSKLPEPVLKFVAALGIGLATIGPMVFVVAQMGVAFGEIGHIVSKITSPINIILRGTMGLSEEAAIAAGQYGKIGDAFVKMRGKILTSLGLETKATRQLAAANAEAAAAAEARGEVVQETAAEDVVAIKTEAAAQKQAALLQGFDPIRDLDPLKKPNFKKGSVKEIIEQLKKEGLHGGLKLDDLVDLDLDEFGKRIEASGFGRETKDSLLKVINEEKVGQQAAALIGEQVVEGGLKSGGVERLGGVVAEGIAEGANKKGIMARLLGKLGTGKLGGALNKIPLLGKLFASTGESAAAAGGEIAAVGTAAEGASGPLTGLIGTLVGNPIGAAVVGITALVVAILGIIPALAAVTGHWDEWWSGFSSVLDNIKEDFAKAWRSIQKAAMTVVKALMPIFKELSGIFNDTIGKLFDNKSDGGGAKKQLSTWKSLGETLGHVLQIFSKIIEAVAWLVAQFAKLVAFAIRVGYAVMQAFGIIKGIEIAFSMLANIIGAVVAISQGHFADFGIYLARFGLDIVNVFAVMGDRIIEIVTFAVSKVVGAVSGGAGLLSDVLNEIPGVDVGDWGDAVDHFAKTIKNLGASHPLENWVSDIKSNLHTKDLGSEFEKQGKEANKKVHDQGKDMPRSFSDGVDDGDPLGEGEDAAKSIYEGFLNALKGNLDKVMGDLKTEVQDAFQANIDSRLKAFDDQIKGLEDLTAAEEKQLKAEEYIQTRKELIHKRALDRENYRRNRTLAIYEGRIDDARNLDLEFSVTDSDNTKSIVDLDKGRRREVLLQQREDAKAKIEIEKDAAKQIYDAQKKLFDKQLELITQYTPKNVAEWQNMVNAIDGLMQNFGIPKIGGAWNDALGTFVTATFKTKADMLNDAFWNGDLAASLIMDQWISKITGIPFEDLIPKPASSSGAGGGVNLGGDGSTDTAATPEQVKQKKTQSNHTNRTIDRENTTVHNFGEEEHSAKKEANKKFAKKYPHLWKKMSKDQQQTAYLMDPSDAEILDDQLHYHETQINLDNKVIRPKDMPKKFHKGQRMQSDWNYPGAGADDPDGGKTYRAYAKVLKDMFHFTHPNLWKHMTKDQRDTCFFMDAGEAAELEFRLKYVGLPHMKMPKLPKKFDEDHDKPVHRKPKNKHKGKDGKDDHGDGGDDGNGHGHKGKGKNGKEDDGDGGSGPKAGQRKNKTVTQHVKHNIHHTYKHFKIKKNWEAWPGMKRHKTVHHTARHNIYHSFKSFNVKGMKEQMDIVKELFKASMADISATMVDQFTKLSGQVHEIFRGMVVHIINSLRNINQGAEDKTQRFKEIWKNMWKDCAQITHNNLTDIEVMLKKSLGSMQIITAYAGLAIRNAWKGIASYFRDPLDWVINSAFNPFLGVLAMLAGQVGVSQSFKPLGGLSVPKFHTGGIVGDEGKVPGVLKPDERLAVLLKGETVVPKGAEVGGSGDPAPLYNRFGINGSIGPGKTRRDFANAFLPGVGAPITTPNLDLMGAWMAAEGTRAQYNPIATTNKMPGSWDFNHNNGYPVQNFKSFEDGVFANLKAINQQAHGYPAIVAGLRDGTNAIKTASAIANSAWGTGALVLRLLGGKNTGYGGNLDGGGGAPSVDIAGAQALVDKIANTALLVTTGLGKAGQYAKGGLNYVIPIVKGYIDKTIAPLASFSAGGPGKSLGGGGGSTFQGTPGAGDVADIRNNMGANYSFKAIERWMAKSGVPFRVTSENDGTGHVANSYHYRNRAVDLAVPGNYGNDTPGLRDIFYAFKPIEEMLVELIHANVPYNIKDHKRVAPYAVPDHHDHVHAALQNGGIVKKTPGGILARLGEGAFDEFVMPKPQLEGFLKSFKAARTGQFSSAVGALGQVAGATGGGTQTIVEETHHHFHVENFIGERSWFDSMMNEHKQITGARQDRASGRATRVVRSSGTRGNNR